MWFQDLRSYDHRRTEMCVIPYATQEGEISFCADNTVLVGGRGREQHIVASTRDGFKTRGRHKIYAGNRDMALPDSQGSVKSRSGKRSLPIVQPVGAGSNGGNGGRRSLNTS